MRAALVACALFACQAHGLSEQYVKNNARVLFNTFKKEYGRQYSSFAEQEMRFQTFLRNMVQAARDEAEQPANGATFGMNSLSDLTAEEFAGMRGRKGAPGRSVPRRYSPADAAAAPDTMDWRSQNMVTHIKDQSRCGSCWAFSTTGNIESRYAIAGNTLTPVSEQEFVSCDNRDHGCHGGLPVHAFAWVESSQEGKVVTEADYPYKSGAGRNFPCNQNVSRMHVGAKISSHRRIARNEEELRTEVGTKGPVSIGVDATKWQNYRGGVLHNCCRGVCNLDHAVLAVGYSVQGTDKYWIIKNSWGTRWGESGYIRVGYGSNECGLTNDAATAEI